MYNRHSIRLPNYDYSNKGFYFVTICSKNKQHIFSNISSNGEVKLSPIGIIIDSHLNKAYYYLNIIQYVIMPNHIHIIIDIINNKIHLAQFVKNFKSKISKHCTKLYAFDKNIIWQRNYYEHIIRNTNDLNKIKNYIKNNPYKWICKKC